MKRQASEGAQEQEKAPREGRYRIDLLKISDSSLLVTTPHTTFTLQVSDLEFREGREMIAETVSFQKLGIVVIHNADDSWRILSAKGEELAALGTGEKREKGGLEKALSPLSYRIDTVEVAEGSTVTFRQVAEGEDYEIIYRIERASISNIRSEPDVARPSRFTYEANPNRHVRILLQGTAQLTENDREVLFSGKMEGLELLSLSPYTRRAMGFAIDSGQADGDIDIAIRDGEIEGHVDVRVNLLTISTTDKKKLKAFQETLPGKIKPSTAIRLLSDKKGTILLKVPVSGCS